MIKAIIFDYGGVIIRNVPDEFAKEFIEKWSETRKQDYLSDHDRAERGEVSDAEVKVLFDGYFGPGSWEKVSAGVWKSEASPNFQVISLIKKLKEKYKIGLLSNNINYWSDPVKTHDYFEFFDAVIFSDDVGMIKPQKEIYELMASKLGVDPSECVFIDDTEANIVGAEAAGMKGIHYQGYDKLVEALKQLNINLDRLTT